MTDLHKAAQQALEALENCASEHGHRCNRCDSEVDEGGKVVAALRAALAQQDAPVEPVAYIHRQGNHWEVSERFLLDDEKARGWTEEPLYTAPPQRKPLTDEEINALELPPSGTATVRDLVRLIERTHGIGETK